MESGCRPPGGPTTGSSRRALRLHRSSQARESVPGPRLPFLAAGGKAAQRVMSAAPGAGPGDATATRGSAHQVRRENEAADWRNRGERRAHGGGGEMRTAAVLLSGSSRGLHSDSGVRCALASRSRVCGAEDRGFYHRPAGSPATGTYLSSRARTASAASGLGPRITATQRIPQTIGASTARLALPLAGFSLPS